MYFNIITNIFTLILFVTGAFHTLHVLLRGGVHGSATLPMGRPGKFVGMALGLSRFFVGIPISSL